jgi:phosphoribosyl 1,2-cyclic phosphodiesterase
VDSDFYVRFWGVRGTVPCPGGTTAIYGGNTSCLEIGVAGRRLIFDGGTGLRPFGAALSKDGPADLDIYFTHTHLDHIIGLPFFMPIYKKGSQVRLWAGHLAPEDTLKSVLSGMMKAPFFPVPMQNLAAEISFHDFTAGETLTPAPGVTIRTAPLNHPNRATGYRVGYGGKSICYLTDTEHIPGKPDRNVLDLIAGADIVVYDCTYTDDEFPKYVGWGHSTWQEGARLCEAAGARQLVIFHHDPGHDDAAMDRIGAAAAKLFPGATVAREGMVLSP